MNTVINVANPHICPALGRKSTSRVEANRHQSISEESIRGKFECRNGDGKTRRKSESDIQDGNLGRRSGSQHQSVSQRRFIQSSGSTTASRYELRYPQICMRHSHLTARNASVTSRVENRRVSSQYVASSEGLEGPSAPAGGDSINGSQRSPLVVGSLNLEGWDSTIIHNLINKFSENHTINIVLCL